MKKELNTEGILVLPVSVAELMPSKYNSDYQSPQTVWEGAYVLDISLDGINERGRITHNNGVASEDEYNLFSWENKIRRSLYMGDVFYTISGAKIKANDLSDLDEIKMVDLS